MPAGFLIAELKGSLAELTEDEDRDLKNPRGDSDGGRRDFSVIHSKQLKKLHYLPIAGRTGNIMNVWRKGWVSSEQ